MPAHVMGQPLCTESITCQSPDLLNRAREGSCANESGRDPRTTGHSDRDGKYTIDPLAVACYAVTRGRIKENETVAVLGAGMIGQCIAQVCQVVGARTIVSEP